MKRDAIGTAVDPAPSSRARSLGPFVLRATVTVGLLTALLVFLPLDDLVATMRALSPRVWALVFAGFVAGHALTALKWRWLVRASGVELSLAEALSAHGAGLFANLFLPSLAGGDVVRAGLVIRRRGGLEAVAVGGAADRLLDTGALVAIAGAAAWLAPPAAGGPLVIVLGVAAIAILSAPIAVLVARRWVRRRGVPPRIDAILRRAAAALDALAARPGAAALVFAMSLFVQAIFVLLNVGLASAIGIELPVVVWFLVWPAAKIVALLPVSLAGIGAREAALAALLVPFGIAPHDSVAQSLLWETVLVAGASFGGLVGLAWRRTSRAGGEAR